MCLSRFRIGFLIFIGATVIYSAPALAQPPSEQVPALRKEHAKMLKFNSPRVARGKDLYIVTHRLDPLAPDDQRRRGPLNFYRLGGDGFTIEPLLTEAQAHEFTGGVLYEPNLAADPVRERFIVISPAAKPVITEQKSRLTMVDLESSTVEVLVDNGMYNSLPVFSPDGNKVAYFAVSDESIRNQDTSHGPIAGYALCVLDIPSKTQRFLSQPALDVMPYCAPAWSPDGSQLAFCAQYERGSRPIHLVHADGSSSKTIERQEKGQTYMMSVVWPDNEFLLGTFTGVSKIVRIALKDGSAQIVVEKGLGDCLSLSPDRQYVAASTSQDPEGRRVRVIDLKGNFVEPGAPGSPTTPLVDTVWSLPPVKHE